MQDVVRDLIGDLRALRDIGLVRTQRALQKRSTQRVNPDAR